MLKFVESNSRMLIFLLICVTLCTTNGQHQSATCEFKTDEFDEYKCELTLNIPNGIGLIDEIRGTHGENKTDDDVKIIETTFVSSSEYIPSIICDRFQNAEKLFIQTGLEKIDAKALKNCKNLQHLNLFFNKIREISEDAFVENKELNFVDISGNQLTILPPKLFKNQKESLKTLLLQGNPNLLLSSEFFKQLSNLTSLSLSTYHPGWFNSLENLEELYLGPSGTLELPINLFSSLKNLKLLSLNEKTLTTLHADSFGDLPNLSRLWLKNDRIEAIDEKIFKQTGITDVNLEGNVCADDRFIGEKGQIMKKIRKCFDNYKNRKN